MCKMHIAVAMSKQEKRESRIEGWRRRKGDESKSQSKAPESLERGKEG